MRSILYPFVLCLIACTAEAQEDPAENGWIQHFRDFRNAVYTNDKMKTKSFIDFPIKNEGNEIWYLVYTGNEKALSSITNKIKPFTEKDLDLHFNKVFSKNFVNAIQKIKTADLYKKGETETVELSDGKATTYKMIASFDKATKSLTLNLAFNTITRDEKGEIMDGGEFNLVYYFDILENGQIRFRQVRMAG